MASLIGWWPLCFSVTFAVVCVLPSYAESSVEALFRSAWADSPAAFQAVLSLQRAQWTWVYADRQRWPSVSIDSANGGSTPLIVVQGADDRATIKGTLGVTLTQRLPGAGQIRLIGAVAQQESWEESRGRLPQPDIVPSVSLDLLQPLANTPFLEIASTILQLEVLNQRLAVRDTSLTMAKAASEVDIARQTLAWRKGLEAVAIGQMRESSEREATGNATVTTLWKAQRKAETARGERIEAETALELASSSWNRICCSELPVLTDEALEAFLPDRAPDPRLLGLEEKILVTRGTLERLQTEAEQAVLAPTVKTSLSASRPSASGWVWDGLLGVSIGTDWGVLNSILAKRQSTAQQKWNLLAEIAQREAQDQRVVWLKQRSTARERGQHLRVALERMVEINEGVKALERRQAVTHSESLAADGEVLALIVEQRRAVWQEILLSWQLDPPHWVLDHEEIWFR